MCQTGHSETKREKQTAEGRREGGREGGKEGGSMRVRERERLCGSE